VGGGTRTVAARSDGGRPRVNARFGREGDVGHPLAGQRGPALIDELRITIVVGDRGLNGARRGSEHPAPCPQGLRGCPRVETAVGSGWEEYFRLPTRWHGANERGEFDTGPIQVGPFVLRACWCVRAEGRGVSRPPKSCSANSPEQVSSCGRSMTAMFEPQYCSGKVAIVAGGQTHPLGDGHVHTAWVTKVLSSRARRASPHT
jgi:hypothetical protein